MAEHNKDKLRGPRGGDERYEAHLLVRTFLPDGTLTYANQAYCDYFGKKPQELIGKNFLDFVPADERETVKSGYMSLTPEAPTRVCEHSVETPAGVGWMEWTNRGFFNEKGEHVCFDAVGRDITKRKLAEEALKESEAKLKEAHRLARMGRWEYYHRENRFELSDAVLDVFGLKRNQIEVVFDGTFQSLLTLIHPDDRDNVNNTWQKALDGENTRDTEFRLLMRDGGIKRVSAVFRTEFDEKGAPARTAGIVQDITEAWQARDRIALSAEVLERFNITRNLPETIADTVRIIKKQINADAAGIRLREGDDFPYYYSEGFSDDFLRSENNIAVRDGEGNVCRNEDGSLKLECTCGLVLSGRADPQNPLFSPWGSAWTNDSLALLELLKKDYPRINPPNRCIHEGYRSVALVPVRAGDEIIGLLHLASRRPGCFSPDYIQFLEGLCGSMGMALLRIQMEGELKASEARFRDIIENAPFGYYKVGKNGLWEYVNPEWERMHSLRCEDVAGKPFEITQPPDMVEDAREKVRRVLSGETITGEFSRLRADGQIEHHSFNIRPVKAGDEIVAVEGFINDISKRKELENALRSSEKRFRQIAESSGEYIWELDAQLRFSYVSGRAGEFLCRAQEEILGKTPFDFMHPEDAPAMRELFAEKSKTEEPFRDVQCRILLPGGEVRWHGKSGAAVVDDKGKFAGFRGMTRDLTILKKMEERAFQQERMAGMGEAAAGIAHEIRNPLSNISSAAQVCAGKCESDETLAEYFRIIVENTQNANRAISDLLSFALPGESALEPGDIGSVLERALGMVKAKCSLQGVNLRKRISMRIPRVLLDQPRLEEAFVNIIINALEAMPGGGDLKVTAHHDSVAGKAVVRFSDSGGGIPPEHADKIYDRFFSMKPEGTGLGLSLVKRIVESHNGEVKAENEPGRGAVFTVAIPVLPEPGPEKESNGNNTYS